MFKVTINDKQVRDLFDRAIKKIPKSAENILGKWAIDVERKARENAPKAIGDLVRSITSETRDLRAKVYTNLKYAEFVETGRKPGKMPPASALERWARVKLGNAKLAFAVAKSIGMHGTKPTYFWKKTGKYAESRIPNLKADLERELNNI
jgi:hypothetical protein